LPAAFDCNRILEIDEMTRNGSKAAAPAASASFSDDAVQALSASFTRLLADMFALYLKTKNFHWHVSGPHFRDYHLLLDDQSEQIFATTDGIAERVIAMAAVGFMINATSAKS
jgi:starvation-inducible DNA-binding protein